MSKATPTRSPIGSYAAFPQTVVLLACLLKLLAPSYAQQAWIPTSPMNVPHTQAPSTLLPNGKVLMLCTLLCDPGCFSGSIAELYDPASASWTLTASPNVPRFNHIAEPLPNGKVLVAGGYLSPGILTRSLQ